MALHAPSSLALPLLTQTIRIALQRNTQMFSEYKNSAEGKATDKRLNDTQWW
jgi:hypothetical protein